MTFWLTTQLHTVTLHNRTHRGAVNFELLADFVDRLAGEIRLDNQLLFGGIQSSLNLFDLTRRNWYRLEISPVRVFFEPRFHPLHRGGRVRKLLAKDHCRNPRGHRFGGSFLARRH